MSRAVSIAELATPSVFTADGVNDRVGIGTTQPTAKLDVGGDAHIAGNISVEGQLTAANSQFRATSVGSFAFSRNDENYQVSMNSGAVSFAGATSAAVQGFYKDINTNTFAIYYDGSSTFAGNVSSQSGEANQFATLTPFGNFYSGVPSPSDVCFGGGFSGNTTAQIFGDGSSEFAGNAKWFDIDLANDTTAYGVQISASSFGNDLRGVVVAQAKGTAVNGTAFAARQGSTQNFTINYDGSAEFAGQVNCTSEFSIPLTISRPGANPECFRIREPGGNAGVIQMYNTGNADFAGDVTVKSSESDSVTARSSELAFGLSNVPKTAYIQTSAGGSGGPGGFGGNLEFYVKGDASNPFTKALTLSYDGGATFADVVEVGTRPATATSGNIYLDPKGRIDLFRRTVDTSAQVLQAFDTDNTTKTIELFNDGSATFAGSVETNFHGIGINNEGNLPTNEAFAISSAPGNNVYTRKTTFYTDGSATFTGTVTDNTSDRKFKENITDAPTQLTDIDSLQLRTWDWNELAPGSEERNSRHRMGLVAQEAEVIDPNLSYEVSNGEDSYKAIDYKVLTMKLLGAVKELSSKNEALEARIAQLESN